MEIKTAITEYSTTTAALATLNERLKGIVYDVTTTKGMDSAKKDRRELVVLRTSLEAKRKEIKAPALAHCKLIDDEAKRITGELLALETPINQQIKEEEARKEAERMAAEQAAFAEVKRKHELAQAELQKMRDEEAAKFAAEKAAFEAEQAKINAEREKADREAKEKQAAIDAENKRIADEQAAQQRELERQAAILAAQARIEAVAKEEAAEKARKLTEAKCADASTAFKNILSLCQKPPTDALAQIAIIAEANI